MGALRFHTELGILKSRPARSASFRAASNSASNCSKTGARLHLRELRPALSACPNSALSAPTGSPIRAISNRPLPPMKIATATSISSQSSSAASGARHRSLAARRRRLAWQLRALQVRHGALQLHQHRLLRSPRSIHLHRAHRALAVPGTANCDFAIFPPLSNTGILASER